MPKILPNDEIAEDTNSLNSNKKESLQCGSYMG